MRILWLCNQMMPSIARYFGLEASNKEGWIAGLADQLVRGQEESGIRLAVAFPMDPEVITEQGKLPVQDNLSEQSSLLRREITTPEGRILCFGFPEDVRHAHRYDPALEDFMKEILEAFQPDVVHCFGTEFPHTLAMARVIPDKHRLLITIQGLCSGIAKVYFAQLPERVRRSVTLRDILRKDTLRMQQENFEKRGEMEREAVSLAGNIGGRTEMDCAYTGSWNPGRHYFEMKETLRRDFYETEWKKENAEPGTIFLSQGDYPLKGLHYMLLALPEIIERYPEAKVAVAGNSLVAYGTLKEKLKLSAYGKYLRSLLENLHIEDRVTFLGRLDSRAMREQYLKSSLYVCCSSLENSPNSLGEAMLLGMPCVAAAVGGIPSLFTGGVDGISYEGCPDTDDARDLEAHAHRLAQAVIRMWQEPEKQETYCRNAREHALRNHDRQGNYQATLEVYGEIAAQQ